jgi:hypothetical protein
VTDTYSSAQNASDDFERYSSTGDHTGDGENTSSAHEHSDGEEDAGQPPNVVTIDAPSTFCVERAPAPIQVLAGIVGDGGPSRRFSGLSSQGDSRTRLAKRDARLQDVPCLRFLNVSDDSSRCSACGLR